MSSIAVAEHKDPAWAFFDAIDAAVTGLFDTEPTGRSTRQQTEFLRRVQCITNRLPGLGHRELAAFRQQVTAAELGDTLQRALAEILRISPAEAKRRVADAENLGPRTALSGEPMQPWLEHTAAAQAAGAINAEHVTVIRDFFTKLPGHVNRATRDTAEHRLAAEARVRRPDELKTFAMEYFRELDQDGDFKDTVRAKRRNVSVGPQDEDGMSRISGWVTPELRATLEGVNAKWAAPGACNPADESPCIDEVTDEAAQRDTRTAGQRRHDALLAAGRAVLASGELGKHHGLPATIIVSTTLQQLTDKTGVGVTAGGTRLPISDVLRLARHAFHYLVIYGDNGEVLHLGRTRRTAHPSQQIVLYDRDRGCTRPGCTVPGYGCEAHHAVLDWARGGLTDVDDLAFACPRDNKLVKEGGWQTRKNIYGETEWIPPPHLDVGQPRVNEFHHPERILNPRTRPPEAPTDPGHRPRHDTSGDTSDDGDDDAPPR